jgi:hypothetical protein
MLASKPIETSNEQATMSLDKNLEFMCAFFNILSPEHSSVGQRGTTCGGLPARNGSVGRPYPPLTTSIVPANLDRFDISGLSDGCRAKSTQSQPRLLPDGVTHVCAGHDIIVLKEKILSPHGDSGCGAPRLK